LPSIKVEKWEDRTLARARRAASAEGEIGVRSTKARAASICIRPRTMAGVRVKRGEQMGDGILNYFQDLVHHNESLKSYKMSRI